MNKHTPTEIKLHQKLRQVEILFAKGKRFELSYELIRAYPASAQALRPCPKPVATERFWR